MVASTPTPALFPSIRRRLASMVYEGLLLLGVLSVVFLLPHIAIGMAFAYAAPSWVLTMHLVLALALYFVGYWRYSGQTLAMQTWKIRLSTPEGAPPTLARLVLRYVLAWFSIGYAGAGLLWALLDRDRQFLHDRLAGTRIVFSKKT